MPAANSSHDPHGLGASSSMHAPSSGVPGPSESPSPPDLSQIMAILGGLTTTVNQLVQAQSAASSAPATTAASTTPATAIEQPTMAPVAPQLIQHIGPIPNGFSGGQGGACLSFDPRHAFPRVEAGLIQQIQTLQFKPENLYKLDHRATLKDGGKRYIEAGESGIKLIDNSERTVKDYKTLDSIIVPLSTFFLILAAAVPAPSRGAFQCAYTRYISYLAEISARYRWHAVYKYHVEFFANRILRSQDGDWLSWAVPDQEIAGQWLHGSVIPEQSSAPRASHSNANSQPVSSQVCLNFQRGACPSPCANGRIHKCKKCNATDHGSGTCSKTAST
ncbi:hypothetical protein FRC08_016969 [Ceratobasidium sp. 394]|nr:hypothetical protein FRC08_016969 [Ceratobasidium sp. 394]